MYRSASSTLTDTQTAEILHAMLDVSRPVAADTYDGQFNVYHIEVGEIGFVVIARKSDNSGNRYTWLIRSWSTYNA